MTRQAKTAGASPFWEGVVVLPNTDGKEQSANLQSWKKEYEKATGHKVLHMSVHLDEGYLDAFGKPQYNPHAHVIVDRMDSKNRVINLDRKQLAQVQDLTASTLQMERGSTLAERQGKRGRAHVPHREFRAQADEKRLELDRPKADLVRLQKLSKQWSDADLEKVKDLKAEITQLKAQYDQDRATLKASGEATQKAYQALKAAHEGALAELKKSNQNAEKMDEYTQKLNAELAQKDAQIASELVAKAQVIEALVKSGEKSDALLVTADGHRAAAIKLTGELAEVKAKFATMAKAYEAHKAAGLPAADFVPGAPAMTPNEAMGVAWWNRLVPQERRQWLAEAKSAIPADAWAAFQGKDMGVEGQKQPPTPFKPITEPTKTAPEPLSEAEAPTAPPTPQKSLAELLADSWGAMVGWIKAIGAEQEPVGPSTRHDGPVRHLDDLHCVQKTGRRYAIHKLADLDNTPALDDPKMTIRYKDGKGTVEGRLGKPGVGR